MQLAILFWFYKEPEICQNHLELLRKYNPNIPIYGLYGGQVEEANIYESALGAYLNDFYVFTENRSSDWKWHLGDLLINDWYAQRGHKLVWDTIIVVQWDMLVFGSVDQLFSMLEKDQILLSGLRPIKEVEQRWNWTSPSIVPKLREKYLTFLNDVKEKYDYNQEPLCCLFVVVCLPKIFMDKYSKIEQPELGFLEYRVPIYAQIFGTPFCTNHPFEAWWGDPETAKNKATLNAKRLDVKLATIFKHLIDRDGVRVFHPYRKKFPSRTEQWLWVLAIFLKEWQEWLIEIVRQVRYKKPSY